MRKITGPLWYAAGIAALFVVWEICASFFDSSILFPGPFTVSGEFIKLLGDEKFSAILGHTFLRVLLGMVISVPLGIIFGIVSGLSKNAGAFLGPLFSLISAAPVMPVILIAFLFLGAEKTPVFTAFLMVFPVMAAGTAEGIRKIDPQFLDLFRVYSLSKKETLFCLYIPSVMPFILGGLRSSISLCWKAVVAAEILVQPVRGFGTGMQQARSRLETPELFAWTMATVISAAFFQGVMSLVIRLLKKERFAKIQNENRN